MLREGELETDVLDQDLCTQLCEYLFKYNNVRITAVRSHNDQ